MLEMLIYQSEVVFVVNCINHREIMGYCRLVDLSSGYCCRSSDLKRTALDVVFNLAQSSVCLSVRFMFPTLFMKKQP